jgi:Cu-Zn family superoxide dismutase
MKQLIPMALMAIILVSPALAREAVVTMYRLEPAGPANSIGVVVVRETADGLVLTPYLRGLPPGEHAFNVHRNVGCGSHYNPDGSMIMGMAAGPIHKGMPTLKVEANGEANRPIMLRTMRFNDVSQRTLVIVSKSAADAALPRHPMDAGPRIACGSLELY